MDEINQYYMNYLSALKDILETIKGLTEEEYKSFISDVSFKTGFPLYSLLEQEFLSETQWSLSKEQLLNKLRILLADFDNNDFSRGEIQIYKGIHLLSTQFMQLSKVASKLEQEVFKITYTGNLPRNVVGQINDNGEFKLIEPKTNKEWAFLPIRNRNYEKNISVIDLLENVKKENKKYDFTNERIPLRVKLWMSFKNILNLNFPEIFTIVIAIIMTISIAYPQFRSFKETPGNIITLKSNSGEVFTGVLVEEAKENDKLLTIISLIGIIIGPVILIWKFILSTKNKEVIYDGIYNELKREYEKLSEEVDFKDSEEGGTIKALIFNIDAKSKFEEYDLMLLKKKIRHAIMCKNNSRIND